jgi:hypothetical protein
VGCANGSGVYRVERDTLRGETPVGKIATTLCRLPCRPLVVARKNTEGREGLTPLTNRRWFGEKEWSMAVAGRAWAGDSAPLAPMPCGRAAAGKRAQGVWRSRWISVGKVWTRPAATGVRPPGRLLTKAIADRITTIHRLHMVALPSRHSGDGPCARSVSVSTVRLGQHGRTRGCGTATGQAY